MNTLIALSGLGLMTLFSEIFGFKKIIRPIILIGLLTALVFSVADWNTNQSLFNDMVLVDNYAVAFSTLLIGLTLLWFLLCNNLFFDPVTEVDHSALAVFALIGAVCMTMYSNMIMLFLGIEILSISLYVLAGADKTNLASNEAAIKYFLMGAFATGFLLFGIALTYGATGSFSLAAINTAVSNGPGPNTMMLTAGVLLLLIAMSFKVSAAPFHFWAPDVYQGAPTAVTAFMSTVVKTAAFAAFLRLFSTVFSSNTEVWSSTLWAIAALTILLGNIAAAAQENIKRMLAYSSVAHAGYMLLAILAMNQLAAGALFFYSVAYSLSSLLSFSILLIISQKTGSETISGFRGLFKSNPLLAVLTIVAMLSLAGIPPTAGFFAKYFVFTAALDAGYLGLVILAVAGSLIGVYYYFRPLMAVFTPSSDSQEFSVDKTTVFVLVLLAIASLALGISPRWLTALFS